MKRLYIIDGSGYLFRAYYGLPEMEGPSGENVHAILGFTRMILKLFLESPDYFVMTWDAPHKTLRHEMFGDYKANRPPAPDDLKQQIGKTKRLIGQLGIPVLEVPGYEADDLIASVARQAEKDTTIHTRIFSSDKDLKQLLSPTLVFQDPMKKLETDTAAFIQKYKFAPALILDYLALVGDASDNIPGVKGIGKKTATKLVVQYGDLDAIYQNIDTITGATQKKLIQGKKSAYMSKKLIELIDVPGIIDAPIDSYSYELDFAAIRKLCLDEYKFASMNKLIDKLQKDQQTPQMTSLFGDM